MPLYKVAEKGAEEKTARLVEASSASAAINHVVGGRFTATNIKSPAETAALMAAGATHEVAGETDTDPAPADPAGEGKE